MKLKAPKVPNKYKNVRGGVKMGKEIEMKPLGSNTSYTSLPSSTLPTAPTLPTALTVPTAPTLPTAPTAPIALTAPTAPTAPRSRSSRSPRSSTSSTSSTLPTSSRSPIIPIVTTVENQDNTAYSNNPKVLSIFSKFDLAEQNIGKASFIDDVVELLDTLRIIREDDKIYDDISDILSDLDSDSDLDKTENQDKYTIDSKFLNKIKLKFIDPYLAKEGDQVKIFFRNIPTSKSVGLYITDDTKVLSIFPKFELAKKNIGNSLFTHYTIDLLNRLKIIVEEKEINETLLNLTILTKFYLNKIKKLDIKKPFYKLLHLKSLYEERSTIEREFLYNIKTYLIDPYLVKEEDTGQVKVTINFKLRPEYDPLGMTVADREEIRNAPIIERDRLVASRVVKFNPKYDIGLDDFFSIAPNARPPTTNEYNPSVPKWVPGVAGFGNSRKYGTWINDA